MGLSERRIKPMLAKLGSEEDLSRDDLLFEPKLDGNLITDHIPGFDI